MRVRRCHELSLTAAEVNSIVCCKLCVYGSDCTELLTIDFIMKREFEIEKYKEIEKGVVNNNMTKHIGKYYKYMAFVFKLSTLLYVVEVHVVRERQRVVV